jgi:hypothetical protein
MLIRKFHEQENSIGCVIAMEISLGRQRSILRTCFPELATDQGQAGRDNNVEVFKRIFAGQFPSIQRNGVRPSYRIQLANNVELYANSLVMVPSIDAGVVGFDELTLHIGIPGPLISESKERCQLTFKRIEELFSQDKKLIALAKSDARRVRLIGFTILFALVALYFTFRK